MKKKEWLFALTLVALGVLCMMMPLAYISYTDSVHSFITAFFRICVWFIVLLIVIGFIYAYIKKRNKR